LLHETGAKSTCFCVCQHHVHVVDEVASLSGLVMFPKPPCRWRLYTSFSRVPGGLDRLQKKNLELVVVNPNINMYMYKFKLV
jgi:hypothetical protein